MISADADFQRGWHLLFSCVGLLHGPLAVRVGELLALFPQTSHGAAEADALGRLVALCFAAFVAWLAFEVVTVWTLWQAPPEIIGAIASRWAAYSDGLDQLSFGWLAISMLAAATAEELVYRALLLRALDGYMNRWSALILHAFVFEAVHVFVYARPFQAGSWFVGALILGYAFQRTRSVAVPVLMHTAHNLTLVSLAWYLSRLP